MAARRKPGESIPNAQRHTVQRVVRLTPAESAALDHVAEARGVNVSRAVGALALGAVEGRAACPLRALSTCGEIDRARAAISASREESRRVAEAFRAKRGGR